MSTIPELTKHARELMHKAVESTKREFAGIRSNKATPSLLDTVRVEAYGSSVPITQVAMVAAPEPRLLTVQPFDKSLAGAVEKALAKPGFAVDDTPDFVKDLEGAKTVLVLADSAAECVFDRILLERVAPRRRADVARPVGEREFGAVGVQARAQVDRARVEQPGDLAARFAVGAVRGHEVVQVVQHRRARGQFGGVDVAVGPEGRLVLGRAGRGVGDGGDPDVAALEALADARDRDQPGVGVGIVEQQPGQRVVAVEGVEAGGRGGGLGHDGGRKAGRRGVSARGTGAGSGAPPADVRCGRATRAPSRRRRGARRRRRDGD